MPVIYEDTKLKKKRKAYILREFKPIFQKIKITLLQITYDGQNAGWWVIKAGYEAVCFSSFNSIMDFFFVFW